MRALILTLLCLLALPVSGATGWRGSLTVENRYFLNDGIDAGQRNSYPSLVVKPEWYLQSEDGNHVVTLAPFARWDKYDDQRSHTDLREANWMYIGDNVEYRIGVGKVFWGVTESVHLVDVINQTDLVENPDGEDKLGQPMLSVKRFSSLGTWTVFALPYFRERTFPGATGRLRTQPRVDTDVDAAYESSRKQSHVDYALRWEHIFSVWSIGVSHFYGTNRDPSFVASTSATVEPVLVPHYELMHQTGLDLQATLTNWLLKLETIHRASSTQSYNAAATGLEYTFYGVFGSTADLGLLAEYLYDGRDEQAPTPFDDDIMFGLRLSPNDVHGTEFLLAMVADRNTSTRYYSLESSRRLTEHLKLALEVRVFNDVDRTDPLFSVQQDDYLQLNLGYYF